MTTLAEQHAEFIARVKRNGGKLLTLKCPECDKPIETQAAPKGDRWTSLAVCPHCEAYYSKVVTPTKAIGWRI